MRTALALLFWLLLALILWLPVGLSLEHLESGRHVLPAALAALSLVVVLAGLHGMLRWRPAWWGLVVVVLLLALIRGLYYGLVQFSGAGFTTEFFIHLEWQSVVVAWQEYDRLIRRVVILLALVAGLVLVLGRRLVRAGRISSLVLVVIGGVGVVTLRAELPEWQLIDGWRQWSRPESPVVDHAAVRRFENIGLLESRLRPRERISATPSDEPRNLVLLYLESAGVNLAGRNDWPGLMPNFHRLLEEHRWVDWLWTSSYITIEGITNSQCGTLFPFRRGSDSLAEGDNMAERLPCLGDVLSQAGYHQVYLGGAGMSFAGKGDFLKSHGYDEVKGMEHWRELGLRKRPGTWGLSDPDLFDNAIDELERLHERDQPFNLTLLTIGTHLPGYRYRECEPYGDGGERFLDALHCTDQLLGRWLERLQSEHLLEDTLLVITADHHVFANPEMQRLFGDDVYDRRLPLIVMGEALAPAAEPTGAGYDLAPSLLDLLAIEHNARFALGRSLARPVERPDYHVQRYGDVHEGKPIRNNHIECVANGDDSLPLPLSECDKDELLGVLESLAGAFSVAPARLACSKRSIDQVVVPRIGDGAISMVVGGEDQAYRFTHRSRVIDPSAAGLYVMSMNETGRVLSRDFIPAGDLAEEGMPKEMQDFIAGRRYVAAWRPQPGMERWPDALSGANLPSLPQVPGAWVVDAEGGITAEALAADSGSGARLNLEETVCPTLHR